MSVLSVRNLCKTYPSFRLENVSFSLEAGRICGMIGRNGAGKTTTVKALLNLIHADSGEVSYFGLPFCGHEAELKARLGYASGAVSYYPRKPIREIVSVTKRFYPQWDEAVYRRYLADFALDEAKTPRELSEGMKVKLNLLLALSHHAELLILDEPTSGLDPFSRQELLEVFRALRAEGVSILFSSHIVSDLEKCVDDILYIRKGSVFASLPKSEFEARYRRENERLEDTLLRLEGGFAQ